MNKTIKTKFKLNIIEILRKFITNTKRLTYTQTWTVLIKFAKIPQRLTWCLLKLIKLRIRRNKISNNELYLCYFWN